MMRRNSLLQGRASWTPRLLVLGSLSFALAACSGARATPATESQTPTHSAPALSAESAPSARRVEEPPAPAARCRLTVADAEGCAPNDVAALVAPARPGVERCRGTSGGKLLIRVRKARGKLTFDVEPGSSLNPTERQCVLDALAPLSRDEATRPGGPNVSPSGFTSLLTIEW